MDRKCQLCYCRTNALSIASIHLNEPRQVDQIEQSICSLPFQSPKLKSILWAIRQGKECFQLPNQTATAIQSPFDSEHRHMRRTHQCVAHPKQLLCYCLAPARASEHHSVFVCPAVTQCVCLDVCMCVCVCECEAHTHPRGLLNQD